MITESMSLGEKLLNSLGLTVLGLAIVFGVLVFIYLVIELMHKAIGEKPKAIANSPEAKPENIENSTTSIPVEEAVEENLQDDGELVAVIAAAIATASGTSIENLVVKSIKPVPQKNSAWAAAGRQEQMLGRL